MAHALPGCVASLQSSLSLLGSSISILDSGVNDFPRLSRVLQTTRHYELLPEHTLLDAQSSVLSTLTPELNSLLSRVEAHLDKLSRREAGLIAKYELQEGRLASARASRAAESGPGAVAGPEDDDNETDGGVGAKDVEAGREALRMKQIRQKKERLSYAVERLTLQAQQKERQLRMSVKSGE